MFVFVYASMVRFLFLCFFQDSLGGNSKTIIIANITPSNWYVVFFDLCSYSVSLPLIYLAFVLCVFGCF